ncbi:MAG: universal stress protein [Dehalococcoidia bacterium]|nr:universal stress protein [Dehalococcoidia bacterium]
MYHRILVPLDTSELAEVALPYAEQMAGRLGSEITLMSVSHSAGEKEQRVFRSYIQETVAVTKERANRYLEKPTGQDVKVESAILVGNPAEEIVDYAERENIDVIVMATHGRSGIGRWALGSVADKVLRATERPVVLIRAKGARPDMLKKGVFKRALVPLDGSKESEAVIPYIEELASMLGAEVTLLQVLAIVYHVYISGDAPAQVPYTEEEMKPLKASAESYLEKVGSGLKGKGVTTKCQVRVGAAGHEIIKLADEIGADIVAMSTHGRSGVGRLVFGSVAEKVVRTGNTPVLLVRTPGASVE